MRVVVTPAAAAELRSLPSPVKARLKKAILAIAADPKGQKGLLEVKRLRTLRVESPVHRLRVGDWRIVYRLRGQVAEVVRVFHRSEGYGWMEKLA